MNRLFVVSTAIVMAAFASGPASAKQTRHHQQEAGVQKHRDSHAMMPRALPTGGNAALSGNNGNSGSGNNSLGHIKGGNAGGGS